MRGRSEGFRDVRLPRARRAIRDMLGAGQKKHMVHGLTEMYVTEARRTIREHKAKTGETLSFTASIAACLAQAVGENPHVQGYRQWRSRLVLFDMVDINTRIEREVSGREWIMPCIIRAANHKTFLQIRTEIRAAQARDVEHTREFRQFSWYLLIPAPARGLFWDLLARSPRKTKEIAGTVGLTSIGMLG